MLYLLGSTVRQSFLPSLLEGTTAAAMDMLVKQISPQPGYLQLATMTVLGALKGKPCSLHSQLKDLSVGTVGALLCGVG